MAIIYGQNPSAAVKAAFMEDSVTVVRWVDIYESDNSTIWLASVGLIDGNVTVDSSRDERRNLDVTFEDLDGTLGYGPDEFWYDKIIKPYRGIVLPDTQVLGWVDMPGTAGSHVSMTRSALGSLTHIEFAVKVQLNALGVAQHLAGWENAQAQFNLDSANKLNIQVNKITSGIIGGGISSVAIPIAAGVDVWLRGRLTISTAVCQYYYSLETTNDVDLVTWTQIGTDVTGSNAAGTPLFNNSGTIYFGTSDDTTAGFTGRLYAGYEQINNAKTLEWEAGGIAADVTSFPSIAGGTVTVTGSARVVGPSVTPGDTWVTCLGEFLPDQVERPRFPNTVHVTCRDFTKKCLKAKFTDTTTFAAAQNVGTVIQTIATNAGITRFSFAAVTNTLLEAVTFEKDSDRWTAMKTLATSIAHELYFDAYGNLVLRPFVDPLTAPVSFTFKTDAVDANLIDYTKRTSDAFLFNHVAVTGDGPSNGLVFGEAENNEISSPTRIAKIGRRTMNIKSSTVADNTAATALAEAYLKVTALEQFEIATTALVVPWLEAGDAVEMLLPDAAPIDPTRYLWSDFNIPLTLDAMAGTSRRVTIVG